MGSWKTEAELAAEGLPQFLRELAAALESGSALGHFQGLPAAGSSANDLRKLVLVAERKNAGLSVKLKALQRSAGEGRQPEAETLESFLSLAGLMAQGEQPLGGAARAELAQANTTFLDDCQALRRAFSARDPAALASVLERLARRKSACHAQFR